MNTTAGETPQCPYCGGMPHQHIGQCYVVKEVEYYPDGTIKREVGNTPRTDAATHGFVGGSGKDIWNIECVDASFAQQLELELAAAERKLEEIENLCSSKMPFVLANMCECILAIVRGEK